MLKKRNLLFLSLFILGILFLSSCFLNPPATEGILKGQVIVPEGSVQAKDLTGQALPDATVNIIDLSTGLIIATTTTDANGDYQVFVPAGGPYLLEAVKDEVKLQQITPPVEADIEYDLGTADCNTTAVALIVQAMLDAGTDLADINLADIESDPNFDDVLSNITSIIEAGGDPTTSAAIEEAVEDFLSPPAPTPTPAPTPAPTPTYTITFDSQGGSAVDSQTVEEGGKVTEPTAPTKLGNTFGDWYKESTCTNAWDFATDTVTSNVTLYAKWTINSYTVTYNGNGNTSGAVPVDPSSPYDYGATVTVLGNTGTLVKTGYTFAGWNTQAGGEGTDQAAGSTFVLGAANVTLYAKWTINSYTVTFDNNGGDTEADPTTKTATHGGNVGTLPLAPTRIGYAFAGWETLADGSGGEFTAATAVTADITVYAQWTPTYTVTFDSQGGSAVDSQTVEEGGKATEPTAPTKTGNTFGGWYKESACTNAWDFATDTVTSNATLYAKWTINSYTVTYNGNGNTSGAVPVDPSSPYDYGATVTVLGNTGTLSKTDYIFAGWNTQADGNGTNRAVGSTFILGAANETLYAKWTSQTTYSLRDTGPAGGLIFYINPDYIADGWRYLEAAPSDQIDDTQWGCDGTLISGADGTAVGTGKQNTIDIENGCATVGTAADICANLSFGGYNDWFLPSKDELNLMYTNLKLELVGNFNSTIYWSSSEDTASKAWYLHFMDGIPFNYDKDYSYGNVRAARAF